jgi:hypothetical protein
MKKTAVISMALVISAFTLLAFASISRVAAQTQSSSTPEVQQEAPRRGWGFDTIIQKLVERFGLNQEEVAAVFEEARDEKRAEMEQRHEERLNEAVQNGKLTEEQKNLILQKKEELQTQREQYKDQDVSQEDWQELREQHRADIKEWADENGIDTKYLMGPKGGHGPGGERFNQRYQEL